MALVLVLLVVLIVVVARRGSGHGKAPRRAAPWHGGGE